MTGPGWWRPDRHAARRPFLLARNRIVAALRDWFAGEGFTEVEPAVLQVSPGNETHLHAFATERIGLDLARHPLYLHTSPEFAMKKLLSAGETRIFALSRVFRNREDSTRHANEFTMLEWYRVAEGYERLMEDCAAMLRLACRAAGTQALTHRGASADPALEPERLTLVEAFRRHAGIDLDAALPAPGAEANPALLAGPARQAGVRVTDDDSWSDLFSKVLSERVEPHLGRGRATILCDYPISEAALARPKPSDPRLAERFELYVCGLELANAFGELTDAQEQRRRFVADMDEKERIYGERHPIDEDFLSALLSAPESSGSALGLDRLVMVATGAERIDQVQWTPAGV